MSHTPGPWTAQVDLVFDDPRVYDAQGSIVAHSIDRAEDAHLIAAAPDMYEAIRAYMDADDDAKDRIAHHLLVDAFDKATGKK